MQKIDHNNCLINTIKHSARKVTKKTLQLLHSDITKNMQYDRETSRILKSILKPDSNTIDIGCHEGEIMDQILRLSPQGKHSAFEPIPIYYKKIKKKFKTRVSIFPYALSSKNGETSFHFVKNAPAYSGIKKRKYAIANPDIHKIKVDMHKLDDILDSEQKIDFIKIDVEGAEFDVLKGSENTLIRNKPFVIFEFGIGGSDYYGSDPGELYEFLVNKIGLKISLLRDFLKNELALQKEDLEYFYRSR